MVIATIITPGLCDFSTDPRIYVNLDNALQSLSIFDFVAGRQVPWPDYFTLHGEERHRKVHQKYRQREGDDAVFHATQRNHRRFSRRVKIHELRVRQFRLRGHRLRVVQHSQGTNRTLDLAIPMARLTVKNIHLVQMDILLNGHLVEELSTIVHCTKATEKAKRMCAKLMEIIPRQQFLIAIQACVGSKILARENLKPFRKDVTAKLVIFLAAHNAVVAFFPQLFLIQ